MLPLLDLLRAPIRGAFMMEIERIRWRGKPIDIVPYQEAKQYAPVILPKMRQDLNRKLGAEVYFADVFKRRTMLRLMRQHNIPIPIDPKTSKESRAIKLIKPMIETYPLLKDFYEDKRMIDAIKNLKLEMARMVEVDVGLTHSEPRQAATIHPPIESCSGCRIRCARS